MKQLKSVSTVLVAKCKKEILQLFEENKRLQSKNQLLKNSLDEAKEAIEINKIYSIDKIKHSDSLIKLHTGLDSNALFEWVYNQYYKGPQSQKMKRYQINKWKKPGPGRMLC